MLKGYKIVFFLIIPLISILSYESKATSNIVIIKTTIRFMTVIKSQTFHEWCTDQTLHNLPDETINHIAKIYNINSRHFLFLLRLIGTDKELILSNSNNQKYIYLKLYTFLSELTKEGFSLFNSYLTSLENGTITSKQSLDFILTILTKVIFYSSQQENPTSFTTNSA